MPESNRLCWACGYKRPRTGGEESRIGRGVAIWLCRRCARDPAAGMAKRRAAQDEAQRRGDGERA